LKLQAIDKMHTPIPELSDHETFRQTISQLGQGLTSNWRSTILEIALVLATLAAPLLCARELPGNQLVATSIIDGFLLLILACNLYRLVKHGSLDKVERDLTGQLGMSIQQRRRADKLYSLSILDPLTGLHNRRFGEERLQEEIERAETTSDPLAVIIFDLDYFKQINDQFGHATGDAALKAFSLSLKRAIRACDVAVRIGGDEFLVVLPDCPREKANIILSRLGSPEVEINFEKHRIHYCVGRAQYQVTDTTKTLLKRADEVLYAQKKARPKVSQPSPKARSADNYSTLQINIENRSFVDG
jgi:diguanylate cyclase (GGDEF)-like protein